MDATAKFDAVHGKGVLAGALQHKKGEVTRSKL
jgi:hypothetical protein